MSLGLRAKRPIETGLQLTGVRTCIKESTQFQLQNSRLSTILSLLSSISPPLIIYHGIPKK